MSGHQIAQRSVAHGTFTVKRRYPQPPETVFGFWADPIKKRAWFGSPDDERGAEYSMDFRVGGREHGKGLVPHDDRRSYRYDAIYQDIVPNERIISSYDMDVNGMRISVSLAVVEFRAVESGTELVVTEHGAFLDGLDDAVERERGTNGLMDALGAVMARG